MNVGLKVALLLAFLNSRSKIIRILFQNLILSLISRNQLFEVEPSPYDMTFITITICLKRFVQQEMKGQISTRFRNYHY